MVNFLLAAYKLREIYKQRMKSFISEFTHLLEFLKF